MVLQAFRSIGGDKEALLSYISEIYQTNNNPALLGWIPYKVFIANLSLHDPNAFF